MAVRQATLVEFDRGASPQYTAERTFVWGLDLSNSLHGAGNIGGLLAIWDDNAGTSNMLVASDGNGNVTQVLKRSDGSLLARFEYDAYGSPVVAAETYAADMPLRFSSKWFDAETGLGYWGYRWYHSRLGRWLSRDPIGEVGCQILRGLAARSEPQHDGLAYEDALYRFCENAPHLSVDPRGLLTLSQPSAMSDEAWEAIGWMIYQICATPCRLCMGGLGANAKVQVWWEDEMLERDDFGGGNAFTHCVVSCQAAKACGGDCAKWYMTTRENRSTSGGKQDLANNDVGFGCSTASSCWSCCLNAWNTGGLTCRTSKTNPAQLGPCPPRKKPGGASGG